MFVHPASLILALRSRVDTAHAPFLVLGFLLQDQYHNVGPMSAAPRHTCRQVSLVIAVGFHITGLLKGEMWFCHQPLYWHCLVYEQGVVQQ